MTAHTPTPWTICKNTPSFLESGGGEIFVQVTEIYDGTLDKPRMHRMWADAALIARAVNSHEAMVKALQDILFTAEDDDSWKTRADRLFILEQARSALALAAPSDESPAS